MGSRVAQRTQRTQGRSRRAGAGGKNRKRAVATQSTFAGGFRFGLLCGAVGALAVVYAPRLFDAPSDAASAAAPVAAAGSLPDFQFWDILPKAEVGTRARQPDAPPAQLPQPPPARTAARQPEPPADAPEQRRSVFLQAAAFRNRKDAEVMRARLLLEGMAAEVEPSPGSGGAPLHHVLVGPFDSDAAARRAAGRLRALDVAPIKVTRPQRG